MSPMRVWLVLKCLGAKHIKKIHCVYKKAEFMLVSNLNLKFLLREGEEAEEFASSYKIVIKT